MKNKDMNTNENNTNAQRKPFRLAILSNPSEKDKLIKDPDEVVSYHDTLADADQALVALVNSRPRLVVLLLTGAYSHAQVMRVEGGGEMDDNDNFRARAWRGFASPEWLKLRTNPPVGARNWYE